MGQKGDDLAPKVAIKISGNTLSESAIKFVNSVTVELARDKADLITVVFANPIVDVPGEVRTSELLWTDALAFQPGNVIEVYFSYGSADPSLVAAGIITKWSPNFPREGIPTITVKAFDGSSLMMDGTSKVNASKARTFAEGFTLTDMVQSVFADYGIESSDVGAITSEPAVPTVKKSGMKDYTFIRGLANLVGFDFYVDWDPDSESWVGHWNKPLTDYSEKRQFVWGPDFAFAGDGNLLDFAPEFAIQNASTDVELYYLDRDTKTWEQVIYPEEGPSEDEQKFKWSGDDTTVEADLQALGDSSSARTLRIKAGGTSVEVLPAQGFRSAEEALNFARDWWQARANLLIQGTGTIVGHPPLRPGQVHELGGLGLGLSGDWYFAEVVHNYAIGQGYTCSFLARKVIP